MTPIAKSIVDAAIKSNVRAPIAFVPEEGAAPRVAVTSQVSQHNGELVREVPRNLAPDNVRLGIAMKK